MIAGLKKNFEAVNSLNSSEMPKWVKNCDTCQYLKKRWEISQNLTIN